MSYLKSLNNKQILISIISLGLIFRLLFILFGAEFFFGRENIYIDGDTGTWMHSIQNLIDHGVYTMKMGHEYGYFGTGVSEY